MANVYNTCGAKTVAQFMATLQTFFNSRTGYVTVASSISPTYFVEGFDIQLPSGHVVAIYNLFSSGSFDRIHVGAINSSDRTERYFTKETFADLNLLTVSEAHFYGYDDPDCCLILFKLTDGTWRQIFVGQIEKMGAYVGGDLITISSCLVDGNANAGDFPITTSSSYNHYSLFSYRASQFNTGAGYFHVEDGVGTNGNWHLVDDNDLYETSYCVMSLGAVIGHMYYNGINHAACGLGWMELQSSQHNYNWSSHLISVPFFLHDAADYLIHLGHAPFIRMVKSESGLELSTITAAGDNYTLFPMMRHGVVGVNKIDSGAHFFAIKIEAGQETPTPI